MPWISKELAWSQQCHALLSNQGLAWSIESGQMFLGVSPTPNSKHM